MSRMPRNPLILPRTPDIAIAVLRAERERQGLSYEKLGLRAKVDQATLWRIDQRITRDPQLRILDGYAGAVGLKTYYLIPQQGDIRFRYRGYKTIPKSASANRDRLGLAARAVQRRTGFNMTQIETGSCYMRLRQLYKLARCYGIIPLAFVPLHDLAKYYHHE